MYPPPLGFYVALRTRSHHRRNGAARLPVALSIVAWLAGRLALSIGSCSVVAQPPRSLRGRSELLIWVVEATTSSADGMKRWRQVLQELFAREVEVQARIIRLARSEAENSVGSASPILSPERSRLQVELSILAQAMGE